MFTGFGDAPLNRALRGRNAVRGSFGFTNTGRAVRRGGTRDNSPRENG